MARHASLIPSLLLSGATMLGVALLAGQPATAQSAVTLHHIHGLAYTADGKQIIVPSHHGLAIYSGGKWAKAPGPEHDYMGFSATRRHLYSSGHPIQGSKEFKNPFGVIRSSDLGATWTKLGLEGETDFHILATGWNTNAIYVWNPAPNSRMKQAGLHYTVNDGFQWQHAPAAGITGNPHALAVHPDDVKTVAIAAPTGIYLSRDSGRRFEPVSRGEEGLAVFFDLDGKHLWRSGYAGEARLARVDVQSGKTTSVQLPPLDRDAVSHIAQNPVKRDEYAIATFARSVYISKDAGRTWTQIADRGKGL